MSFSRVELDIAVLCFPGSYRVRPQRAVTVSPRADRLDQRNFFRLSATLSLADCLRTPVQTACQKLHARKTRIAPCQVVLALGVCGTSRRWPQSSTLPLYAKLQNIGVVRFSLRNSIQQGVWTCQNFDLWMQELTTRLGVSGILCARPGRRRVSSRTSSVVPKCRLT